MTERNRGNENRQNWSDTHWTAELVRTHVVTLIDANDRRYEDRFEAQEKAVKDAFAASEKAVNAALAAQEKAVNAALAASEKAVSVAENNAEKWRDNANEWRGAMTDRESKFTTRTEFDALKERVDRSDGGGKGQRDMWGWVVAGVLAAATLFNSFWPHVK